MVTTAAEHEAAKTQSIRAVPQGYEPPPHKQCAQAATKCARPRGQALEPAMAGEPLMFRIARALRP
jgi:hypothetical protein